MTNLLNMGGFVSQAKDALQSLLFNLNAQKESTENPENQAVDFAKFKDILLDVLKENNVINEDFKLEELEASSNTLNGITSEFEQSLMNVMNLALFKYIDTDKNGIIDEEETEEFTNQLARIYGNDLLENAEQKNEESIDLAV